MVRMVPELLVEQVHGILQLPTRQIQVNTLYHQIWNQSIKFQF